MTTTVIPGLPVLFDDFAVPCNHISSMTLETDGKVCITYVHFVGGNPGFYRSKEPLQTLVNRWGAAIERTLRISHAN